MGLLDTWKTRTTRLITAHYERYVLTALSIYGIAVHLSPAQVFFLDYITEETELNISSSDAFGRITPVRTYSYLILLLPVILLTDIVRYKPALVAQVSAYVCGYIATLVASSVGTLQFAEFVFGVSWALQIAQLTYGFASLHSGLYKKVSAYVQGCNCFSIACAAAIGQLYIGLTDNVSVTFLSVISLVTAIFSGIWIIILPQIPRQRFIVTASGIQPVQPLATINAGNIPRGATPNATAADKPINSAVTFKPDSNQSEGGTHAASIDINQSDALQQEKSGIDNSAFTEISELQDDEEEGARMESLSHNGRAVLELSPVALHDTTPSTNLHLSALSHSSSLSRWMKSNFQPIWLDFSQSYSNSYILKWSLWWTLMTCVYIQATWYGPQLWEEIAQTSHKSDFLLRKAVVNMVAYIIGGILAFVAMVLKLNWRVLCDLIVTTTSFAISVLWIMSSQLSSIWLAYITYVTFIAIYMFLLTVASFEIAGNLRTGKFALVFGTNNFLGGILHMVMMVVFVVLRSEDPDFRTQMLINGIYILILAVGFLANIFFHIGNSGVHVYLHNLKQQSYQEIENTHI